MTSPFRTEQREFRSRQRAGGERTSHRFPNMRWFFLVLFAPKKRTGEKRASADL